MEERCEKVVIQQDSSESHQMLVGTNTKEKYVNDTSNPVCIGNTCAFFYRNNYPLITISPHCIFRKGECRTFIHLCERWNIVFMYFLCLLYSLFCFLSIHNNRYCLINLSIYFLYSCFLS